MHDLNDALDELRGVIPYAHSPSVRKLSKIATLLLAKNYILMQANALDELRRLIAYMNSSGVALPPGVAAACAAASAIPNLQGMTPASYSLGMHSTNKGNNQKAFASQVHHELDVSNCGSPDIDPVSDETVRETSSKNPSPINHSHSTSHDFGRMSLVLSPSPHSLDSSPVDNHRFKSSPLTSSAVGHHSLSSHFALNACNQTGKSTPSI